MYYIFSIRELVYHRKNIVKRYNFVFRVRIKCAQFRTIKRLESDVV